MYGKNLSLEYGIRDLPETTLLNDFLLDCSVRNFSPRTIQSYKSNLKYFLSRHSVQINPDDLKNFLIHIRDKKHYSPSTVGNYFAALSSFYDWLEWEGVIEKNIVPQFRKRYLRYYKEQRHEERQLINLEQMRALIDSAEWVGFKSMFIFFAKTGIRRQELIDLDLKDLYLENRYAILKPHAKRSNRVVFFDNECAQVLEAWLSWRQENKIRNKALFLGTHGSRINRDTVYDVTTEHAQSLGFHNPAGRLNEKFTPHCFRHFFTTWLRRSGCPRSIIQELRGDARKEAIDIYDHITQAELKESYIKYIPLLNIKI
ncbi:Site-specific recombinase [Methanosarcina horonobensis HB-1 = JCM 15518]|uniref:Site-specific recombinase n=1 Tax=Methanosarcina horonobensis HB-1 = JCM 15518 TaxID=1434110 RepID=A0A0E3WW62_9EURY|nr:tyrosine-type recombinase/integrase [Methanosarcina horonobensis]AKB79125.1 Site-specific recombinase [Methanosarcina horonobensis HB-1 = JCM 15518]